MHLRGYHLKANRLFELLDKPSAAFMAADSRTISITAKISETSLIRVNAVGAIAC